MIWRIGTIAEANALLREHHYLGPMKSGGRMVIIGEKEGEIVAAQVWRHPTSRRLPQDWLELSRWCLTPQAGEHAGSRQHATAVRLLGDVTTLVSYSDPSQGHTGALYRACNWRWSPTWQRLRPPPTGAGNWGTERKQNVKDRWIFLRRRDDRRADALKIDDRGAIRFWLKSGPGEKWLAHARRSPAPDLAEAAKGVISP